MYVITSVCVIYNFRIKLTEKKNNKQKIITYHDTPDK
jgi:type IV secretory pathway VirB9-like protein